MYTHLEKNITEIYPITTVNSVRGDPLRKLLLIVSYHFVRKVEYEPITDAYSINASSGGPQVGSILPKKPKAKKTWCPFHTCY